MLLAGEASYKHTLNASTSSAVFVSKLVLLSLVGMRAAHSQRLNLFHSALSKYCCSLCWNACGTSLWKWEVVVQPGALQIMANAPCLQQRPVWLTAYVVQPPTGQTPNVPCVMQMSRLTARVVQPPGKMHTAWRHLLCLMQRPRATVLVVQPAFPHTAFFVPPPCLRQSRATPLRDWWGIRARRAYRRVSVVARWWCSLDARTQPSLSHHRGCCRVQPHHLERWWGNPVRGTSRTHRA
jgi:hypothetical protein